MLAHVRRLCFALACLLFVLTCGLMKEAAAYTYGEAVLTCPVDGTKFKVRVTMSMTTFGSHLDFQKTGAIGNFYEDLIYACPVCHFAGHDKDFEQKLDAALKQRVLTELKPAVAAGQKLDDVQECEFAARIYEWQQRKAEEIADIYLVASYLLRESEGAASDPRRIEMQKRARAYFIKALDAKEIAEQSVGAVSYLIAELYRRTGEFEQAVAWYDRALAGKQPPDWLKSVAEKQKALALKKDANNQL